MEESSEQPKPSPSETPPASFNSLVITLALSAMEQLDGGPPDDQGKPRPPQPRLAKPMIDTLEVLKEKTKGNLTPEEADLLDSVLVDLRLRYLKASGSGPEEKPAETAPQERPQPTEG